MAENKQIDFVIVGGQKCGTTSLAGQLTQLAQVCFCQEKEPHFFSKTDDVAANLEQYFSLYDFKQGQLLGEASTTYSFIDEYPETPERLYKHNPDLKLIFMLRDPVDRIESHFNHRIRNKTVNNNPLNSIGQHPCFIERSQYAKQIATYLEYFPQSQICILSFDDYIKEPKATLIKVVSFLELSQDGIERVNYQASNVSDGALKYKNNYLIKYLFKCIEKLPLSYKLSSIIPIKIRFEMSLKRLIWMTLESDMRRLEQEHQFDCSAWRSKYSFDNNARIK